MTSYLYPALYPRMCSPFFIFSLHFHPSFSQPPLPPPHINVVFPHVLRRKKIPWNGMDMCTYTLFSHINCPLNQRENIWPQFWIIKMTTLTHIHFTSWGMSLNTGTEADATLFCVCLSVLINFKGTAAWDKVEWTKDHLKLRSLYGKVFLNPGKFCKYMYLPICTSVCLLHSDLYLLPYKISLSLYLLSIYFPSVIEVYCFSFVINRSTCSSLFSLKTYFCFL
jgi:hypothetical protein